MTDTPRSVPLKYLTRHNVETLPETTDRATLIEYIEISDVQSQVGIVNSSYLEFGDAPSRARRVIRTGDVLVSTVRTYLRAIASAGEAHDGYIASTGFCVLRAKKILPSYLKYAASSPDFVEAVVANSTGVSYPAINASDLVRLPIPVTDQSTQHRVAAFLDRETAQIDVLIEKQERLIELLAEKRQAIITQAVTKGLDPSTPTKPSGVPWVPPSPVHWTASRIKWTGPNQESGTSVNASDVPAGAGEIGVLKTGSVSKGRFVATANKTVVPEDIHRVTCPVRGGTLIVNRANTPDLVGTAGVPETDMPTLFLSDKLWQIDFKHAHSRFMYWWTKTDVYRSQIQFRRVGASSSMQNLSYPDFLTCDLAMPPKNEQAEIAEYLDARTQQIDALASKAKTAITLLRERRSALISAAVTGKIDVRGEVA